MVRAAERPFPDQSRAAAQKPGHRINRARFQRFLIGQRRQNARQPFCQHGLTGTRRADQQQVVPTCGGNLHRPAGLALPAHIGHIRPQPDAVLIVPFRRGRSDGIRAAQVQHNILGTAGRVDGQPFGHSGFGSVLGGQKQLLHAVLHSGHRHGQNAGHGAQCAVQAQLP